MMSLSKIFKILLLWVPGENVWINLEVVMLFKFLIFFLYWDPYTKWICLCCWHLSSFVFLRSTLSFVPTREGDFHKNIVKFYWCFMCDFSLPWWNCADSVSTYLFSGDKDNINSDSVPVTSNSGQSEHLPAQTRSRSRAPQVCFLIHLWGPGGVQWQWIWDWAHPHYQ
jgi:hypothetical protein